MIVAFDKESYRAYLGSRLRSTIESCDFKKSYLFITSALSDQY